MNNLEQITNRILPQRVLTNAERPEVAEKIKANLLESLDATTAFVLVDQATKILKETADSLKEKAINGIAGKSTTILGATVGTKSLPAKWQYNDPGMDKIQMQIDVLTEQIKARQKRSQLGSWIDESTGEVIEAAKMLEQGTTIVVTPPKEY